MNPITLDAPRVFHIPDWGRMGEAARIGMLRDIALRAGRDPRVRELAFRILAESGTAQRDYRAQATAILSWIQREIKYVNEPGEVLQDPLYTVRIRAGDCDDMAILGAALFEAVRLPWRYVLAGKGPGGEKVRWMEGGPPPSDSISWAHIYLSVRLGPYNPAAPWVFAEPTVLGAPLGWDVFQPKTGAMPPELSGDLSGPFSLAPGGAAAGISLFGETLTWGRLTAAVLTGVVTMLAGAVAVDAYRKLHKRGKK